MVAVEEVGFSGVDGVGDLTDSQFQWLIAAKRDKAERKREAQEQAQQRAQNQ